MSNRTEALNQLESFLKRVPAYESTRNYDRPNNQGVSQLSHWIRYRVITEEECVRAVLAEHPLSVSQKFIQEILWRTYWKGWLEMRPTVWQSYVKELHSLTDQFSNNAAYLAACEGRTQLTFFNDWVKELTNSGYLHNHTRMWFASVWIFTLRLPWQLGAAFMYHHLLDGDPASNTLSWRWVGGLHTPGKVYVARPDNIATFSDGRWAPDGSDLAHNPTPLPFDGPHAVEPLMEVSDSPVPNNALALLHDDHLSADLSPEFSSRTLRYVVLHLPRTSQSKKVRSHISTLLTDTSTRTHAPIVDSAEQIATLAHKHNTTTIHSMLPTIGFERSETLQIAAELQQLGIVTVWHRTGWDCSLMPHARGGFFKFWESAQKEIRQKLQLNEQLARHDRHAQACPH
jgi:deoxyribodipyrimidine photo-lyase